MRAPARFHSDDATWLFFQEGEKSFTRRLLSERHAAISVSAVRLESTLCKVETDDANLLRGCPLPFCGMLKHHQLGTFRCRREGHPLHQFLQAGRGFRGGGGLRRGGLSGSPRERDMGLAERGSGCRRRVGAHQPIGAAILEAHLLQPIEIAQQFLSFRRDARLAGKIVEIFLHG